MTYAPVLTSFGKTLPEAWENSLSDLWFLGGSIINEYEPDLPPGKDATSIIVVKEPLAEPRIHRDLPGTLKDLQEYRMEIMEGIKDHVLEWTGNTWKYTYHERLFKWEDQINRVVEKLAEAPCTRRAQAVTWQPGFDNCIEDPPCLQSMWFRIFKHMGVNKLVMNVRMRSNDAYRAAFMNMFAFTCIQEHVASKVSGLIGEPVEAGRYCHQADSFHIYSSCIPEFEDRFLKGLNKRSFEDRTYRYDEVRDIMEEYIPEIRKKADALKQ